MNDPFKNFKPLNTKTKKSNPKRSASLVESLKDISDSTVSSLKKDSVKGTAQGIFDQLLTSAQSGVTPSETTPSVDQNSFYENFIKDREQIAAKEADEQARSEERQHANFQKRENVLFSFADEKLKQEIAEVRQELALLFKSMDQVEAQIEQAIIQEVVDPGTYHLNFFRRLKSFVITMRKSLEDASLWLSMSTSRSSRSRYRQNSKTYGTKFSQSLELSSARSVV